MADIIGPMHVIPAEGEIPEEVGGTLVADVVEVTAGIVDMFGLAVSTFGTAEALSGLVSAHMAAGVRFLKQDDFRATLQQMIGRLPAMYEKQAQRDRARLEKLN